MVEKKLNGGSPFLGEVLQSPLFRCPARRKSSQDETGERHGGGNPLGNASYLYLNGEDKIDGHWNTSEVGLLHPGTWQMLAHGAPGIHSFDGDKPEKKQNREAWGPAVFRNHGRQRLFRKD